MHDQRGNVVAWVAIVLSLLAIGVTLYGRQASPYTTVVPTPTPSLVVADEEANLRRDIGIARLRLLGIGARLTLEKNYAEAREELADVRAGLEKTFATVPEATQQQWVELKQQLDTLDDQLGNASANALQTLEELIRRLRESFRTQD